jgi:hypothetical protein
MNTFETLTAAETFLADHGFRPVGVADWIGPDGDDAGVYESDKGYLDRDHHTVARP